VETIGLGRRQVLARQLNTGGLTARLLGWPVIVADRVQWAATCFGEGPCGADVGLRRRALADGRVERASVPGPPATGTSTSRIVAHTRDRSATYVLVDSEPGADCVGDPAVPGGTCQLVELKPLFH
jgi:hypothetical protein